MSKFPALEKFGLLLYNRDGSAHLNENKFFSRLTYAEFLEYDLNSSYPKIKLDEVEKYLAKKSKTAEF